jgi:cell division septum initiation protein DivIVA
MAGNEGSPPNHSEPEEGSSARRGIGLRDVRDPLPPEVRDPSFATAVRGYDRHAVDHYVERVNGLIAEMQISGSPRAAVRHALDRVGEQTSGILQRARETAEEIIASAREEAEETTARARAEAQEIVTAAEREASELTSKAGEEAGEIVTTAQARAEDALSQANTEAERTLSSARADAEAQRHRSIEEIAALHEQAEARMRALEADIAKVADARGALLGEARRLSAALAQVVADAAAADPQASPESTPPSETPPAPEDDASLPAEREAEDGDDRATQTPARTSDR